MRIDAEQWAREERRASNIIWNAAQNYAISPEYKAFDENGEADLYLNIIIGLVYRYWVCSQIWELFRSFQGEAEAALYEGLFWLGLENSAFERAESARPALRLLRREYAEKILAQAKAHPDQTLLERLTEAHFRRTLGQEDRLGQHESRLLDSLELDGNMSGEQIVEEMRSVLREYFGCTRLEGRLKRHWRLPGKFRWGRVSGGPTSSMRRGDTGNHGAGGLQAQGRTLRMFLQGIPSETQLRAYLESRFGESLYGAQETAALEKRLCYGAHRGCRLHLTRGVFRPGLATEGEGAVCRGSALAQGEANRAYYRRHQAQARVEINRLTQYLRNAMLAREEDFPAPARAGRLEAKRAWRAACLQDGRIFFREERDNPGNLTVDILLDGSASQINRQEMVALQAYIIAESMTRCKLPVRVYSFCSVKGCTVLHMFRDYDETEKNSAIFDYAAAGWNRDGLALRTAGALLERSQCENKVLFVLSDATPSDDGGIPAEGAFRADRDYAGESGIRDAAEEVRRLRQKGVFILCIFTGEDRNLPAAKMMYGADFARLHSIEQFAVTVGRLVGRRLAQI